MQCEQCGDVAVTSPHVDYGELCDRCSFRQAEFDDASDRFDHLAPSTFGFMYDDC